MSTLVYDGPRAMFRPALPNWPACVCRFSRSNAERLSHSSTVRGPALGSPTRFGSAGGEAGDRRAVGLQRDVGRVRHREGRAGVVGGDHVQLPAAEDRADRGRRADRESAASSSRWRRSGGARRTATGPYSASRSNGFCARSFSPASGLAAAPGQVHRREMVERSRIPVRHVEAERSAEAPRDARLARLIRRARDVSQHRDRREIAGAPVGGTVGVDPSAVGVLRRGARTVDRGIGFDVARQIPSGRADVADLDEISLGERPLDAGVPVLHGRRLAPRDRARRRSTAGRTCSARAGCGPDTGSESSGRRR